jgi:hypothetical protein
MKFTPIKLILCILLMLPAFGCRQVIRNSDEVMDTASDLLKVVQQVRKTDEFKNFKALAGYEYQIIKAEQVNDTQLVNKIRLKKKQKITEIRCMMKTSDNTFIRESVGDIQEVKYDLMNQYPDEIKTERDIDKFINSLCVAASK